MESILRHLAHFERRQPNQCLFSYLDAVGKVQQEYTYRSFSDRTRRLAAVLKAELGLQHGDRALLVYPPGLDSIVAFFACLRLGVIPAPVYAPPANSAEAGFDKLEFVARDCQAKAALSTSAYWGDCQNANVAQFAAADSVRGRFAALPRFSTNELCEDGPLLEEDHPHRIMFLQYTSGSTGDPKGVIATHANVMHNNAAVIDHRPTSVSWLPQYHDMGLIGHYLYMVLSGGTGHGFSAFDFLRRPALWLQTISRTRATITAAPNFAYEYCLREDKVPQEALRDLDLSSMRIMLNAAEPVRAETFRRFHERFAPYGLSRDAYVAGYGLAENTVAVSMHGCQVLTVNKQRLQQRSLRIEKLAARNNNQVELVSCGRPLADIQVRIVEPESSAALCDDQIGEIWVGGGSKCEGYWGRPQLNREIFEAGLAGEPAGSESFLRTGDLGFLHEGELYVCGRVKDLIIIRGVNYYPQDIEAIVEAAFPQMGGGGLARTAAFSVDEDGEERLVVMIETRNRETLPEPAAIVEAIRARYFIEPHTIAFVPPRTISKTTSGKVARGQTRDRWIQGELPVLSRFVNEDLSAAAPQGLKGLLDRIQQLYDLEGREHQTIADIGMDSLTMVDLVLELQKHFEARGAGSLLETVDAGFLQAQSIAKLFSLVESAGTPSNRDDFGVKRRIKVMQEEHTAAETSRMRSDANCSFPTGGLLPAAVSQQRVLLTGPTGFFGPFLLAGLLDQTPAMVDVLVRAADEMHGQRRIAAALRRAGLWTSKRESQVRDRVRVVCGDLAQDRLGLDQETWQLLAEDTQAILHNGATVNYVHSYESLRSHNVGGTRELLRLATTVRQKPFHLISSTFIFGWSVKPVLWETDCNAEMARLDFGYSQSKWVAEELVRKAAGQGLPTQIYRPSLISPSTARAGSRDDIAIRLLAFMINHQLAVDARNQISFLPADVAADNIVSIFHRGQPTGGALHVTADEYYNFADVTRMISSLYGYSFRYHDIPEFIDEMNRLCTKDDLLYPLRPFLTKAHRKISAMEHKRYNNRDYLQARQIGSGGRQEPPLAETVSAIVEFMLHEGIIPSPPGGSAANGHSQRGNRLPGAGLERQA